MATAVNAQGLVEVDDPVISEATSGVHESQPEPSVGDQVLAPTPAGVSDPVFMPTPVPSGRPSFPDPDRNSAGPMPDSGITGSMNTFDPTSAQPSPDPY